MTGGVVGALLRKDARVVYRDRFLLWMLAYPLLLPIGLRFAVPLVPVDHLDLYLAPVAVLFGPMLLGTVLGFSLIEEREHRTWLLLRVLPIGQRTLFGYVLAVSTAFSLPLAVAATLLYGVPVASPGWLAVMAVVGGLSAPLIMFAMGALAANKIEGLALSKVVSSASWFPALAFVLSPAWQLALVWNPFYWIYLGLLRAYAGPVAVAELAIHWPDFSPSTMALAGAATCLAGSYALARVYRRKAD